MWDRHIKREFGPFQPRAAEGPEHDGFDVIISFQVEAVQSLESKARLLKAQIQRRRGEDSEAERRLEIIERVLGRLYREQAASK